MNGLIIVNKEKGLTSREVVNKIGSILNTKRIGHTGTLDPIATGVLVLAIGEGLKLVDMLTSDTKEYIAEVKAGIFTDTLDLTGNIIKKEDFVLKKDELISVLNSFLGKSIQEVPLYSSIRVDGKRLYEYARENIPVVLPKREIEVFSIELLGMRSDSFTFKVLVSKGTYIRSLIRDIGNRLDILCTMKNLKRTKQGIFCIENSYTIDDIKNNNYSLISINEALSDYKTIEVDDYLENKIKNGSILENRYQDDKIVFVNKEKKVLAIYQIYEKDNKKIKPYRMFN